MRTTRLLLSLCLITAPAAAFATGCGGDDSSGNDATPDASTSASDGAVSDGGAPPPPDATAGPEAVAAPVSVYFGQRAALDGSTSTGPAGLTYAWKVTSAPAGSAITTASLTGANTAKPTFVPDRPGAYELELTVAAGAATSSIKVPVTAVDPPIFYFHTEGDASAGFSASLDIVGAGAGDGGKPVSCFSRDAGGAYDTLSEQSAKIGADWWEAPAGQPSRIAFVFETPDGDGGATSVLAATTSNATCAAAPAKLDTLPGAATTSRAFEQPRLSPSGNRIAYLRTDAQGSRIATVGFDGASKRTVAAFRANADGGPDPDAGAPVVPGARPVWINETTVAWLQTLDATNWQIVSAPDQASATPTLLMSCTGTAPMQFDVLPNGEVLVTQSTGTSNTLVTNLLAYSVTAGTKACALARNISNLTSTNGQSYARDFSVSPDKTHVAYHARNDATADQVVMVAKIDGTTPPAQLSPSLSGTYRGPRWVGGGAFLTWGATGAAFDAGLTGNAVAVAALDGGVPRAAAFGPDGTGTQAIGNGSNCSFAPAVGSGVSLFGMVGILALRLVRRRRSDD